MLLEFEKSLFAEGWLDFHLKLEVRCLVSAFYLHHPPKEQSDPDPSFCAYTLRAWDRSPNDPSEVPGYVREKGSQELPGKGMTEDLRVHQGNPRTFSQTIRINDSL